MSTTLQGIELSVAILMDDLATAKEIASALRQCNIFAHHYQNLDEFWVSANHQTPDLVIVDVLKTSQGSVQFKNHPKVMDKTLCYAFFSKESSKVLLQSTLGMSPYGYLHSDAFLSVQVTGLVQRRAHELNKEKEIKEMSERMRRLQARSQRLISERSSADEFRAHFGLIQNMCAEIEDESTRLDFNTSLINKLEKWEAIEGYGIYELNQSGQKLIGPDIQKKKYHPFPALWLGQANLQGIETFAQDMAVQVANDLFEIDPIMVKIHGGQTRPDVLLFVSFTEERMMNFPWEVFEAMLSSSFRRLKLYQQVPQYTAQFMPMWEAMDTMDRMQISGPDMDSRIICLSLIPLIDVAKRRPQNKFYWSSFFNDFFLQLSGRLQKTTKLSLFGPWHVMFFVPKENVETELQMLQSFSRQFSYWKFFEDNSQVLSEEMMPVLKIVPASSGHYLRLFEKEFEELGQANEGKRLVALGRPESSRLSF